MFLHDVPVSREIKNIQTTMTQKHVGLLCFFKSGVDGTLVTSYLEGYGLHEK